jgi:hypothetical protein
MFRLNTFVVIVMIVIDVRDSFVLENLKVVLRNPA